MFRDTEVPTRSVILQRNERKIFRGKKPWKIWQMWSLIEEKKACFFCSWMEPPSSQRTHIHTCNISIWLPPERHSLPLFNHFCPLMRPYRGHHINTKQPPLVSVSHTALTRDTHPRWLGHKIQPRERKKPQKGFLVFNDNELRSVYLWLFMALTGPTVKIQLFEV